MNNYLDYFLEQQMNSVDGEEIKGAIEAVSIEEKNCLELFNPNRSLGFFGAVWQ